METRAYIKGVEWPSLLGLGCMRLPQRDDVIDEAAAQEMVDTALANGVNYFDTAYYYHNGQSEAFVGRALAKHPRDSYYLATKLPIYDVQSIAQAEKVFNEQLERCQTEYFDFYLFHTMDAKHFATMKRLGLYEYLQKKKESGQIRHLGFSFHDSPEVLREMCDAYEWDFVQIQLNFYDWTSYRSGEQYQILAERQIPCIIMEPLRGGWLSDMGQQANAILKAVHPDKSIASWGMRYAASLPNVLTVLSGMSSRQQLDDNLKTFSPFAPLNEQERDALQQALAILCQTTYIPCTGCQYCMPCPFGVNIPLMLSAYNEKAAADMSDFDANYMFKPEAEKAEHCTQCHRCEELCPQHINISHMMQEIVNRVPPAKLDNIRLDQVVG